MKSLSMKLAVILAVIGPFVFGYGEVRRADWRLYGKDDFGSYYYGAEGISPPS